LFSIDQPTAHEHSGSNDKNMHWSNGSIEDSKSKAKHKGVREPGSSVVPQMYAFQNTIAINPGV
jgi:hypothetical protein